MTILVAMGEDEAPKRVDLLAAGCGLAEARRLARERFGADRVLEVRPRHGLEVPLRNARTQRNNATCELLCPERNAKRPQDMAFSIRPAKTREQPSP